MCTSKAINKQPQKLVLKLWFNDNFPWTTAPWTIIPHEIAPRAIIPGLLPPILLYLNNSTLDNWPPGQLLP